MTRKENKIVGKQHKNDKPVKSLPIKHLLHRNASERAKKKILLQLGRLPTELLQVNKGHQDVVERMLSYLEPGSVTLGHKEVWTHADKVSFYIGTSFVHNLKTNAFL